MTEPILKITGKLTQVAELVMDVDTSRLDENELDVLRERLPAWSLTLRAMSRSVTALEASLRQDSDLFDEVLEQIAKRHE